MSNKLAGKTIAIIVAQEYEDIELLYPILRLSEEGATVLVAAVPIGTHPRPWLPDKPVTGRFGHPVPIPVMPPGPRYRMVTVEELSADHVDCLLFPGGFAPDYLRRHDPTLALTRVVSSGRQDPRRHLPRAVGVDLGRSGARTKGDLRARRAR